MVPRDLGPDVCRLALKYGLMPFGDERSQATWFEECLDVEMGLVTGPQEFQDQSSRLFDELSPSANLLLVAAVLPFARKPRDARIAILRLVRSRNSFLLSRACRALFELQVDVASDLELAEALARAAESGVLSGSAALELRLAAHLNAGQSGWSGIFVELQRGSTYEQTLILDEFDAFIERLGFPLGSEIQEMVESLLRQSEDAGLTAAATDAAMCLALGSPDPSV